MGLEYFMNRRTHECAQRAHKKISVLYHSDFTQSCSRNPKRVCWKTVDKHITEPVYTVLILHDLRTLRFEKYCRQSHKILALLQIPLVLHMWTVYGNNSQHSYCRLHRSTPLYSQREWSVSQTNLTVA